MTTRSTFDEFVLARTRSLLHTAYLLTGDTGTAEDLLQTALVKAHRSWSRITDGGDPEAYVRRILVNTYATWWRRRWRFETPHGDLPEPPGIADHADAVSEHDVAWRLVQSLPARQRAVLVLRYWEDLPEAEIAEVLGISRGTVKSQAAKALARLRLQLAHPDARDGGGLRVRT